MHHIQLIITSQRSAVLLMSVPPYVKAHDGKIAELQIVSTLSKRKNSTGCCDLS